MIKLARQVILCANGITKINGGSKELPFALLAACHGRNLTLISQDDEGALCHGADSLSQFQGVYHYKEVRHEPTLENRPLPVLTAQNCCCSARSALPAGEIQNLPPSRRSSEMALSARRCHPPDYGSGIPVRLCNHGITTIFPGNPPRSKMR
jgi:hypothetical protein